MHNQKHFPSWLSVMKCLVRTMGKLPAGTGGSFPALCCVLVRKTSCAPAAGHSNMRGGVRCCCSLLALVCSSMFHPSFAVCPSRVQRGNEHGTEVWDSERWLLRTPQPAHWEVLCILGPGSGCFYHSYGVWTRVPGQAGKGTPPPTLGWVGEQYWTLKRLPTEWIDMSFFWWGSVECITITYILVLQKGARNIKSIMSSSFLGSIPSDLCSVLCCPCVQCSVGWRVLCTLQMLRIHVSPSCFPNLMKQKPACAPSGI